MFLSRFRDWVIHSSRPHANNCRRRWEKKEQGGAAIPNQGATSCCAQSDIDCIAEWRRRIKNYLPEYLYVLLLVCLPVCVSVSVSTSQWPKSVRPVWSTSLAFGQTNERMPNVHKHIHFPFFCHCQLSQIVVGRRPTKKNLPKVSKF